jgi:hypothetical protein
VPGPVSLPATAVITLRALPALLIARLLEARKSQKRTLLRTRTYGKEMAAWLAALGRHPLTLEA